MSFDLNDYVDVAERIRIFREKHPEGSLQSEVTLVQNRDGFLIGVLCKATAHRTPDDPIPGNGHSYLGVPGKTPYTKDSEVENAETSAWGRAIVAALAADTKKVASADEVRAKHEASAAPPADRGAVTEPAKRPPAPPNASDGEWTFPFGKHKGRTVAAVDGDDPGWLDWFLANGNKEDVKDRIREHRNLGELAGVPGSSFYDDVDSDVPFRSTIDGWGL